MLIICCVSSRIKSNLLKKDSHGASSQSIKELRIRFDELLQLVEAKISKQITSTGLRRSHAAYCRDNCDSEWWGASLGPVCCPVCSSKQLNFRTTVGAVGSPNGRKCSHIATNCMLVSCLPTIVSSTGIVQTSLKGFRTESPSRKREIFRVFQTGVKRTT